MSKTLLLCLLAAGMLFSSVSVAHAQDATAPPPGPTFASASQGVPNATAAPNSNVVTLWGCLGLGAGADEYTLYGQNATSWEVKSNSVDLRAFEREAVTVAAIPQSDGTLNVISLTVIAEGCAQY